MVFNNISSYRIITSNLRKFDNIFQLMDQESFSCDQHASILEGRLYQFLEESYPVSKEKWDNAYPVIGDLGWHFNYLQEKPQIEGKKMNSQSETSIAPPSNIPSLSQNPVKANEVSEELSFNHSASQSHPSSLAIELSQPAIGNRFKKGNDVKNRGHSIKHVIKAYVFGDYSQIVERLHQRFGLIGDHSTAALNFYRKQLKTDISLGRARNLINFQEGNEEEKIFKKPFLAFFRYYMRECYPVHVVTSKDIKYKTAYLMDKNRLIYLLKLTKKGLDKLKHQPNQPKSNKPSSKAAIQNNDSN